MTTLYQNSLCEFGLECGVSQFTRVEKRLDVITRSCIDHVFVRSVNCCVKSAVINSSLADHYITGCALITNNNTSHSQSKTVHRLDNKKVCTDLKSINWNEGIMYSNPNTYIMFYH